MKKRIIVINLILFILLETISFALNKENIITKDTLSFVSKEKAIASNFNKQYEITNNSNNDKDDEDLKQEIYELTKKTTFLLLGEPNNKIETSENYYKRHNDYLKLRYNPSVPKDENTFTGLDENSQEYKDDLLSGISVPGMFSILNELEINYNSYGEIRSSKIEDNLIISTIKLSNITMKEQDENEPMKYNTITTDLNIYYYFKKLNDEFKLLYLYGETNDDIEEYIEKSSEKFGELVEDLDYNSHIEDLYNFSNVDAITDEILNEIYDSNKTKIVFLNATYNTGNITSANGFFINNHLIVTTYNFIENALMKAQNIIISDNLQNIYELDGIVTANIENDIAILKVRNNNQDFINNFNDKQINKEDAVITLNSKNGIGLTTTKGIIITAKQDIQTSLPMVEEMQGSPLFDKDGKLLGMLNSKSMNTSISYVTGANIIQEYFEIFKELNYDDIKSITFESLKSNYYIKYNEEKEINNIPEDKWDEFSKIENIEESISLKLVKGNYADGIISLRYKNEIPQYIDTMQLAYEYIEKLKNKGYKEINISDSKATYENEKYQIIISSEFDYLIIVMVKK